MTSCFRILFQPVPNSVARTQPSEAQPILSCWDLSIAAYL